MPTVSDRTRMASQEAAYWYIRCTEERAMRRTDRKLFLTWLKQSPENVAEILRIVDMDGMFARQRLMEKVKGLGGDSNVLEGHFGGGAAQYDYQPSKSVSNKVQRKANARSPWRLVAAVAAITVAAWLGFAMLDRPAVLETAASEWQHKQLKDGSTIHMDARTRLKVELTDGQRIVHLDQGQAAFDVAKDSRRPFIVRTPLVDVIAVGTRFSVSLDSGVTTIVEEGVVKVLRRGEEESPVMLKRDEQLHIDPVAIGKIPRVSEQDKVHVNAKAQLEWTTGWVTLDGATVAEMAKQFNHRHITQVVIEDPTVASKVILHARVKIDSVDLFKRTMDSQEGVAVIEDREHKTLRLLPE